MECARPADVDSSVVLFTWSAMHLLAILRSSASHKIIFRLLAIGDAFQEKLSGVPRLLDKTQGGGNLRSKHTKIRQQEDR